MLFSCIILLNKSSVVLLLEENGIQPRYTLRVLQGKAIRSRCLQRLTHLSIYLCVFLVSLYLMAHLGIAMKSCQQRQWSENKEEDFANPINSSECVRSNL